jgi:hypothetical protein
MNDKDIEGLMDRIKHSHDRLFEMSLRDIETLLADSENALHGLKRKIQQQQGKADLMSALEVANLLKAGCCQTQNATIYGFGSETIRMLIEEVEWRRKAMRDEDEGNLVGLFDGQFVRRKDSK